MLIDYVRNSVERIIATQEQNGDMPAACTLNDLITEAKEDILECMRQLHRDGDFRATVNINKIPMLIRRENETN
ncbi:MAG TPA: hypothetical protein DCE24_08300 [Porphyromonadaceae bacterium]|nr:hypothetical protein [Porphyromonadaceae bacterium]